MCGVWACAESLCVSAVPLRYLISGMTGARLATTRATMARGRRVYPRSRSSYVYASNYVRIESAHFMTNQ